MSRRLVARLQAGDPAAARFVGLPTERFTGVPLGPVDQATHDLVAPLVERAGLVAAFNDAWLWIGGAMLLSLALVPLLRALPRQLPETRSQSRSLRHRARRQEVEPMSEAQPLYSPSRRQPGRAAVSTQFARSLRDNAIRHFSA